MNDTDAYWMEEAQLCMGTFRFYHDELRPVWAQVHVSQEPYTFEREEQAITPVTHLRGTRTYVHAQVFAWECRMQEKLGRTTA